MQLSQTSGEAKAIQGPGEGPADISASGRVGRALTLLLAALAFGLAHTQAPLYYSNQNQYFLHGLATGGSGYLNDDWLARTQDPTPVFSGVVAATFRIASEHLFYIYYLLILGLYFATLVGLYDFWTGPEGSGVPRLVFMTLLIAVHAGGVRLASVLLFGKDYPWYLQAGIANQYVLGPGLQPSVFGVLLILSIYCFVRDWPVLAVVCSSLAVAMHSTYLLPAAFLTAAYLLLLFLDGKAKQAVLLGILALLLVLPVVLYNLNRFGPTSAETFGQAQELLVQYRLPHHALPGRWLDPIAGLQLAWIGLGTFLVRGSRLFVIMVTVSGLAVLLTLVQWVTGSDTLALLFPWRISAILVPIATAIILTRLVQALSARLVQLARARGLQVALGTVMGVLVVAGLTIQARHLAYRINADEDALLAWVRNQRAPGQVFLLPVELPVLGSGPRGAASLSFTRPPRPGDRHLIAVDFLRFRLATGAPIYVDFKSIPYKDTEVLEWHRRLLFCQAYYRRTDWQVDEIRLELTRNGVTHVITTSTKPITSAALEKVYEDAFYFVYRLR